MSRTLFENTNLWIADEDENGRTLRIEDRTEGKRRSRFEGDDSIGIVTLPIAAMQQALAARERLTLPRRPGSLQTTLDPDYCSAVVSGVMCGEGIIRTADGRVCLGGHKIAETDEKPDLKLHTPPAGSVFKHYKDGALYRVICTASAHPIDAKRRAKSRPVMVVRVATNNDDGQYEYTGLYAGPEGLWMHLPYGSVIYVSQTTLEVYARKYDEFYGDVEVSVGGGLPMRKQIVKRFEPVTT